jgi:2-polyprenyl-3-methyl-5-hydroxy-6-metoxy-1,4-benzoquinol methylase
MTTPDTEEIGHDPFGKKILDELAPAVRLHKWIADSIAPYLGDRILEVASGVGNISQYLPRNERLTLSDYDPQYRALLAEQFGGEDKIDIVEFDLTSDEHAAHHSGRYDTIVCLNVLEHIEDDSGTLKRLHTMLEPGGKIILQIPQYPALMSDMDRNLGHYRRYTKRQLSDLLVETGYEVVANTNFNFPGVPGWYVNNTLLGRDSLGNNNLKLFNALVPIFRVAEALLPLPGLSVISVGQRPG